MKRLFVFLLLSWFFLACNSRHKEHNNSEKQATADNAHTFSPTDLPYAVTRGRWQTGDPRYTKIILDMYKAWEENRLQDVAGIFDTLAVYETASGRRIQLTSASIIDTLKNWRSFQEKVSTEVMAAVTLHDPDRNEDWVSTWTMNRWTDTGGAHHSILANENWKFVNGKITYSSAYEARPVVKK